MYVGSMISWYASFCSRHPEISERFAQPVDRKRIDVQNDTASISNYFNIIERFKHLPPQQIFAADETGLDGDGARRKRVMAPTGARRVLSRGKTYEEHTSILNICSADGSCLPPAFVFKGDPAKIDPIIVSQLPPHSRYAQQVNGYFLKSHFIGVLEHLVAHAAAARPLLLVVDGCKAHVDLNALNYAIENNIHIVFLPAYSTHLLQVADIGLFGPLKHYWKKGCETIKIERQRMQVAEKKLTRQDIIPIFMEAWYKSMTSQNIRSAFAKSGIYPFDPLAYIKNSKTGEIGEQPCTLSIIQHKITQHHILMNEVPSHVRPLLPHVDPPPPDTSPKPDKCNACGSDLKKKRQRQVMNSKAGLLLTDEELVKMIHEADKEEADRKQRCEERKIAAAEKKRLKEEKKQKRDREKMLKADADKENRSPSAAISSTSTSTTHRNKKQKQQHHNTSQTSISNDNSERQLTAISQRQSSIVLPNCPPFIVTVHSSE